MDRNPEGSSVTYLARTLADFRREYPNGGGFPEIVKLKVARSPGMTRWPRGFIRTDGLINTASLMGALVTAPYRLAATTRYSPSSDSWTFVRVSDAAVPTVWLLKRH